MKQKDINKKLHGKYISATDAVLRLISYELDIKVPQVMKDQNESLLEKRLKEIDYLKNQGANVDHKKIISEHIGEDILILKARRKTGVHCPACKWKYFDKDGTPLERADNDPDFGKCNIDHEGADYEREIYGCKDFENYAMKMDVYLKQLDEEIMKKEAVMKEINWEPLGGDINRILMKDTILKYISKLK